MEPRCGHPWVPSVFRQTALPVTAGGMAVAKGSTFDFGDRQATRRGRLPDPEIPQPSAPTTAAGGRLWAWRLGRGLRAAIRPVCFCHIAMLRGGDASSLTGRLCCKSSCPIPRGASSAILLTASGTADIPAISLRPSLVPGLNRPRSKIARERFPNTDAKSPSQVSRPRLNGTTVALRDRGITHVSVGPPTLPLVAVSRRRLLEVQRSGAPLRKLQNRPPCMRRPYGRGRQSTTKATPTAAP